MPFIVLNASRGKKYQDDCSWCVGIKDSEDTKIAVISLLFSFFFFFPHGVKERRKEIKIQIKLCFHLFIQLMEKLIING